MELKSDRLLSRIKPFQTGRLQVPVKDDKIKRIRFGKVVS
jgi:hypothetical protein